MADSKISGLTDGSPSAAGDQLVVARSGVSNKIVLASPFGQVLYDYTVTGSDKASIDTNVDGSFAGLLSGAYNVLEIFALLRTDDAAASAGTTWILNNDTSSVYDFQRISGSGTAATVSQTAASASWGLATHGSGGTAGYAGGIRFTIPNYAGTTFFKTASGEVTEIDATSGSCQILLAVFGYRSTAAISRVKAAANGTDKFKVGSRLMVYGR